MGAVTKVDQDIRKIIQNSNSESHYPCLETDERWEVFYHLSPMRSSLLNWYEFKENASLLEVGGGFGALTGLFCDRCQHVITVEKSEFRANAIRERYQRRDNLTVINADVSELDLDEKFDYVIIVGILEGQYDGVNQKKLYADFINMLLVYLKPNGKLLLATDNRYGLQYFCGDPEPYSDIAFFGVNHYPKQVKGFLFSKRELVEIIEESGCNYYKFYYPLPDYKLTQIVYSDAYLPDASIRDRVIFYHTNSGSLIALEDNLIDDIINNGVLDFFSNSYLIECSMNEEYCPIICAVVSTDRGEEHSFATTISEKDIVKKKALHEDGMKSLQQLFSNMKDIENHGVKIVSHELKERTIVMPLIRSQTLVAYMSSIIESDTEMFIQLFELLYQNILLSSEHVSEERNILKKRFISEKVSYGIILKRAYIDMIPYNCFFRDGQLLFYDQEFVREDYPANYVLFRALRHSYFYIKKAEAILPLQFFKDKYGLNELWGIYEQVEAEFVEENRKYEFYKQFYKWASVDRQQIYDRSILLNSEETR